MGVIESDIEIGQKSKISILILVSKFSPLESSIGIDQFKQVLRIYGLLKLVDRISARLVERRLSYDHKKLGVWFIPHCWSISHSRVPCERA